MAFYTDYQRLHALMPLRWPTSPCTHRAPSILPSLIPHSTNGAISARMDFFARPWMRTHLNSYLTCVPKWTGMGRDSTELLSPLLSKCVATCNCRRVPYVSVSQIMHCLLDYCTKVRSSPHNIVILLSEIMQLQRSLSEVWVSQVL